MNKNPSCLTTAMYNNWFLLRTKVKEELGIDIRLSCTSRTEKEHFTVYSQGREKLSVVNGLRKELGWGPITEKDNVAASYTLNSKHVVNEENPLSRAFDIYILKNGKADYDDKDSYKKIAEIGRRIGMKAGADFGDYCHFEEV